MLELTDFSMASVLAVMKFLYAGVLCLPKGSMSEIKELASRSEPNFVVFNPIFSNIFVHVYIINGTSKWKI